MSQSVTTIQRSLDLFECQVDTKTTYNITKPYYSMKVLKFIEIVFLVFLALMAKLMDLRLGCNMTQKD